MIIIYLKKLSDISGQKDEFVDLTSLSLPVKVSSKGRTKESGPLKLKKCIFIDNGIKYGKMKEMLLDEVDEDKSRLNDQAIFYFFKVLKKNCNTFEYMDSLYSKSENSKAIIGGKLYSLIIKFQIKPGNENNII